jgi:hypothetical protein
MDIVQKIIYILGILLDDPRGRGGVDIVEPPTNARLTADNRKLIWDAPSQPPSYYRVEYKPNIARDQHFQSLADHIVHRSISLTTESIGGDMDAIYELRVRSIVPPFGVSAPSNSVLYTNAASGLFDLYHNFVPNPNTGAAQWRTALAASIIGGLLFFLLFVVFGCLAMRKNARKRHLKQKMMPQYG